MLQNHIDAGQLNATTHRIHFNQRSDAPPTPHPSLHPNRKGPETTCHVRVGKCGSHNWLRRHERYMDPRMFYECWVSTLNHPLTHTTSATEWVGVAGAVVCVVCGVTDTPVVARTCWCARLHISWPVIVGRVHSRDHPRNYSNQMSDTCSWRPEIIITSTTRIVSPHL